MVDLEARQQHEASGALTPRGVSVMPDTPTEVVTAWNADVMGALIAVSKAEICGARVGNGEVDFLACAGPVDRPGGTSCGWATHETRGKEAKRQNVLKMSLLDQGEVFAIPVNASRSLVKRPKIFSTPVLPQDDLPYAIFNKGWDEMLTTIRLMVREWKYLIEAYPGESWMVNSYFSAEGQGGGGNLPKLSIPSPSLREREADPSPALQELDPEVPETGFTPLLSEGLLLCQEGRPGPLVGTQRTDFSVHLSRSGESKRGREQALPPYV